MHGFAVNPANGALHAATHQGVFRLPAHGGRVRVGDGRQDTMGFRVVGADHFLASGHPGEDQDGATRLHLIESLDGGASWRALSLHGAADLHA